MTGGLERVGLDAIATAAVDIVAESPCCNRSINVRCVPYVDDVDR